MRQKRGPWAQVPARGLLTTADVCRVLKVSDRMVRYLAAAGELQGEQTWSGRWVFVKRDVVAFWTATGGRAALQRRGVTATGQLPLPVAAPRIRRPKPLPWTWARFRPALRMAKAALPDPEVNQRGMSKEKWHVA